MKLIVVIPTMGRKGILTKTLAHLARQRRLPDEVVISATDESDVGVIDEPRLKITRMFGKRGLTAQRNLALEHVLGRSDIITFFDDDFLPGEIYLERLIEAFARHPEWAVINGGVIADGARGSGLTFEEGLAALAAHDSRDSAPPLVTEHPGAYGCNMSMRSRDVGALRFDERLVLYGWQEDIDFTAQLRGRGKIVNLSTLPGVHLGAKTGRVSGVRLGFSQIVNPAYLVRKGTMPTSFAIELVLRNLLANLAKSIRPEPWIDRRGRLRGNIIAIGHLLSGRVEPEHALKLA